jgi:CHAT domain-containing protein
VQLELTRNFLEILYQDLRLKNERLKPLPFFYCFVDNMIEVITTCEWQLFGSTLRRDVRTTKTVRGVNLFSYLLLMLALTGWISLCATAARGQFPVEEETAKQPAKPIKPLTQGLRRARELDDSFLADYRKGNLPQALRSAEQALAIYKEESGWKFDYYPEALQPTKDFAKVKELALFEPILQLRRSIFEQMVNEIGNQPLWKLYYGVTVCDLGLVARSKKEFGIAETTYLSAVDYFRKVSRSEIPRILPLSGLALMEIERHNYAKAEALLKEIIRLQKQARIIQPGKEFNLFGGLTSIEALYKLAEVSLAVNSEDRAIDYFKEILSVDKSDLKANLSLANIYKKRGDFTSAEKHFQRVFEKQIELASERWFLMCDGVETDELLTALIDNPNTPLSQVKGLGVIDEGCRAEFLDNILGAALGLGSESTKLKYFATLKQNTDKIVERNLKDPEFTDLALQTILRRKGRVLDALSNQISNVRRRLGVKDRAILDRLSTARTQLATMLLSNDIEPDVRKKNENQLLAEIKLLEADLSAANASFPEDEKKLTIQQIQMALPSDSALVELYSYWPESRSESKERNNSVGRAYVAYVLTKERKPTRVQLPDAETIDDLVELFRMQLFDETIAIREIKETARELEERILRPIRREANGKRKLFLSPDGILNLLPFAALMDEHEQYIIENYTLTYLSSGRDLMRAGQHIRSRQAPVLVGDPLYDLRAAPTNKAPTAPKWPRLLGTQAETKQLSKLLNVRPLMQENATERVVKRVAGPSILNIATHGFFQPSLKVDDIGQLPLVNFGLVLAGANVLTGGEGEDGLLTALETSDLDLAGTELVVLSACGSGLGDVRSGDGIYGLRRALVLAGSETQVMTLWSVDDTVTTRLIVDYYKRLLSGEGRAEALRRAQLTLLRQPETRHPTFWAGLIQSGSWKALSDETRSGKKHSVRTEMRSYFHPQFAVGWSNIDFNLLAPSSSKPPRNILPH